MTGEITAKEYFRKLDLFTNRVINKETNVRLFRRIRRHETTNPIDEAQFSQIELNLIIQNK